MMGSASDREKEERYIGEEYGIPFLSTYKNRCGGDFICKLERGAREAQDVIER